jgi:hypothetical protein
MTVRVPRPRPEEIAMARAVFALLETDAAAAGGLDPALPRPVLPGRLRAWLVDPAREDPALEAALAADPGLRAVLRRLAAALAGTELPALAAAARGPVERREGPGCRIRLEPSRAEPSQTYVIVTFDDPARRPRWLAVFTPDDRCARAALPEVRNGIAQFLVEEGADLLAALRDRDSVILVDA